jgi:KUP system potassium uptake protein
VHGGFFPLLVGALMFVLIDTWMRGEHIVAHERHVLEGSLQDFTASIKDGSLPVRRLPGQAVFIGHHENYTPMALRVTAEQMHELPRKVAIVIVQTTTEAHVPPEERATFDDLTYNDGISQVILRYGFHDVIDVPRTLQGLRGLSPELDFDPYHAEYFVSLTKVISSDKRNLARWRKLLYRLMARNRLSTSDFYKLPIKHTEEMQSLIKL